MDTNEGVAFYASFHAPSDLRRTTFAPVQIASFRNSDSICMGANHLRHSPETRLHPCKQRPGLSRNPFAPVQTPS